MKLNPSTTLSEVSKFTKAQMIKTYSFLIKNIII